MLTPVFNQKQPASATQTQTSAVQGQVPKAQPQHAVNKLYPVQSIGGEVAKEAKADYKGSAVAEERSSQLSLPSTERKTPVVKMHSLGMSIRRTQQFILRKKLRIRFKLQLKRKLHGKIMCSMKKT